MFEFIGQRSVLHYVPKQLYYVITMLTQEFEFLISFIISVFVTSSASVELFHENLSSWDHIRYCSTKRFFPKELRWTGTWAAEQFPSGVGWSSVQCISGEAAAEVYYIAVTHVIRTFAYDEFCVCVQRKRISRTPSSHNPGNPFSSGWQCAVDSSGSGHDLWICRQFFLSSEAHMWVKWNKVIQCMGQDVVEHSRTLLGIYHWRCVSSARLYGAYGIRRCKKQIETCDSK